MTHRASPRRHCKGGHRFGIGWTAPHSGSIQRTMSTLKSGDEIVPMPTERIKL
jgi:hypothetical protein